MKTLFANNSQRITQLQNLLLKWYQKNKRDLPWRKTKDPYAIWVSEIMLQQTRVDTAIPYYERFLKKFPTVKSLAETTEHDVLKQWQGLGYYRRAKLIYKAAKEISVRYGGNLPSTRAELETLPGFGPYTSGAVASIAFNECAPAVDGNVKRVLSRIFATDQSIEKIALEASQVKSPSDWTQALMELGALVCIPKNPKCTTCAVQKICAAFETNTVQKFPVLIKKTSAKKVYATTWIVEHAKENKILLQQRPDNGRWANMWEFPTEESIQKNPSTSSLFFSEKNIPIIKLGSYTHQLTHQNIQVEVFKTTSSSKTKITNQQKWVNPQHLNEFPISKMQLKALELFQKFQK